MKNKEALERFSDLEAELEKDHDPFMFVHFSRVENGMVVGKDGTYLNKEDALKIIRHLMEEFAINLVGLTDPDRNVTIEK
jgi:hypothetical protein